MTIGRRAGPALAFCLAAVLTGCAGGSTSVPSASPLASSAVPVSAATTATASQIGSMLRVAGVLSSVSPVPYRPAESPALADAARVVLKADLAGDPDQGFIVIYDFPDAGRAFAAGGQMADYLASGPGRVQFADNARFVMRQVGSTLVFYSWKPSDAPEPGAAAVATALGTLGVEIPIVR